MTVDQLKNMPFQKFEHIQLGVIQKQKVVSIVVDRKFATKWILTNKLPPGQENVKAGCLTLLFAPIITIVGLLIYIALNSSWWLLISIPFLVWEFFLLTPSSMKRFGPKKHIVTFLLLLSLFASIYFNIEGLIALCLVQVINWLVIPIQYTGVEMALSDRCLNDETLFCDLWEKEIISLQRADGVALFASYYITKEGNRIKYTDVGNKFPKMSEVKESSVKETIEMSLAKIFMNSLIWMHFERGGREQLPGIPEHEVVRLAILYNKFPGTGISDSSFSKLYVDTATEIFGGEKSEDHFELLEVYEPRLKESEKVLLIESLSTAIIASDQLNKREYIFVNAIGDVLKIDFEKTNEIMKQGLQNNKNMFKKPTSE